MGAAATASAQADFYLDYALFYRPPAPNVRVEFYFGVPLQRLKPAAGDGGTTYKFNVGYRLSRTSDNAIVAEDLVSKTASAGTDEVRAPLSVGRFAAVVPPGDYELSFGVADLGGGEPYVKESKLTVSPAPAAGPFASSIVIANAIAPVAAGTRGEFIRDGLSVIPNPTKLISDNAAILPVYFELYRLPRNENVKPAFVLHYDVSQLNGRRFVSIQRPFDVKEGVDVARVEDLDLAGVPPASYVLTMKLNDASGRELLQVRKEFMIYHQYDAGEIAEIQGKFNPYSLEEEKRVRKELTFVGTDAEVAAFDALPPEEKPIFVENFWARRDPDKDTPENEYENAFYNRYYYVQEHFATPFQEGADSDQGRVYLKYGKPDEVISSPMGLASQVNVDTSTWQSEPFEAWEYLTPGGVDNQYILFVFVDSDGDGAFELDAATVPGYGRLLRAGRSASGG